MKNKMEALGLLALGQFLSLLITGAGFSTAILVRQGINAPTSQSLINYFVLALVYGPIMARRKQSLKAPWYFYLILALMDVEGNYFATKSYQYTSITSVMLLDCWSIPCVLALTAVFMNTRYFCGHVLGVGLCVLGLGLVVLSDVHKGDGAGGSNVLLGDMLIVIGATMYAFANVLEEFLTSQSDQVEILAMMGTFGLTINTCQVLLLERQELASTDWSASAILAFISYAICQLSFSSVFLYLIQHGGSALFNLSLLTSDTYAVAIRSTIFHQSVDWLYFVAFATVAVGLVSYSLSGEPPSRGEIGYLSNKEIQYEPVQSTGVESLNIELQIQMNTDTEYPGNIQDNSDFVSSEI